MGEFWHFYFITGFMGAVLESTKAMVQIDTIIGPNGKRKRKFTFRVLPIYQPLVDSIGLHAVILALLLIITIFWLPMLVMAIKKPSDKDDE